MTIERDDVPLPSDESASVVRRAERKDAGAIAVVHVASWKEGYRGLLPDDYLDALAVEDRLSFWEDALNVTASTSLAVFVVEDGKQAVVGFATFRRSAHDGGAELGALYLDPGVWGRGLGGQLLDAVVAEARIRGDTEISLWVHPGNRRARAFYEHRGWTDTNVEIVVGLWGLDVPERRYRLAIS